MENKISISCLPVAGSENPYQQLMIKGLKTDQRLIVKNGIHDRFFGIIRTAAHRPDYIHFDWETSYYYRKNLLLTLINVPFFVLQVYVARFFFGCKLAWTPHNITPHDSRYIAVHRFCRRFFARNMDWIRLFSEKTIPVAARELQCAAGKFKIIPEGSYVDYYPNSIDREAARHQLNIGEQKKVMLYLGLIKPYKGITSLIECFNRYYDENTVLIIAGRIMDINYGEHIKRLINARIILIDRFIKGDELQVYFNAADVVVLPFKKIENSGSAILAMGFKKAVIAPQMGVLTERLGSQAKLLYTDSLEQSFQYFEKMTREELEQVGENNFHSLSKYQWSDFAKAF